MAISPLMPASATMAPQVLDLVALSSNNHRLKVGEKLLLYYADNLW